MVLNSISNPERILGAPLPFGGVLGLDLYTLAALLNHSVFVFFFFCAPVHPSLGGLKAQGSLRQQATPGI